MNQMKGILCYFLLALMLLLQSACKKTAEEDHFAIGHEAYKNGNYIEAIQEYQFGLELSPDSHEMRIRYANILEDSGNFDDAIIQYKRVLENRPKHVNAHIELASIYRKKKEYDKAIELMEKALKLKAGEGWIWNVAGNIYQESGDIVSSIKYFEKAACLDPSDSEFRTDLANVYVKIGREKDALVQFHYLYCLIDGLTGENSSRYYPKEAQYASDMIKILTREVEMKIEPPCIRGKDETRDFFCAEYFKEKD